MPPGQVSGGGDAAATKGALSPGVRLRHYEIREVIGQGSFGITYAARDLTLNRDVAVKEYLPTALALRENGDTVVPRSTATAADFLNGRERFLDEARTLARLDHLPAIVRVLDFLETNGTAYMVMALARGETLAAHLQRVGRLDQDEVDRLLPALLDGLEEVHRSGFLHRDIKPANILIDKRGLPTLIDFGAARVAMAGASVAMTAIFTPGYAAPEQFSSGRQGPWTDIYGLAATLYHAIAGQAPPQAVDRIIDDKYAPLHNLARGPWRRSLLAAIDAGLAVRAADRPQSIAHWRPLMKADLGTVGDSTEATVRLAQKLSPATPAASPSRLRRLWIAAGVALVLLVSGGGAYWGFIRSPSTQVAMQAPKVEESERVLAERQQADTGAVAAEKRRLEEEAKRAADAERAKAEQERLKAEADAKSRADEEARQKAEADAKAQAEAQAQTQAQAQAQAKAEAEAKAKADAETDRKAAEAAETALRLTPADRQRVQVALSAQGFDTRGADGVFGPHSRDMIASWQKARGQPATGFLAASQQQLLLKEAAAAVSRFDEEEKKKTDEARRKEQEAKAAAPAQATTAAPASGTSHDGLWFGSLTCSSSGRAPVQGTVAGGTGTFTAGNKSLHMEIKGDSVTISLQQVGGPVNQVGVSGRISGQISGRSVYTKGTVGTETCAVSLVGP